MVKTIKICTWAMMIALFVGTFSSCSKDDDVKASSLIGKWQMIGTPGDGYDDCDYEGWVEFKTGSIFGYYDACYDENLTGTWTLVGKTLTTKFPNEDPEVCTVVSVTKTELTLEVSAMGITVRQKLKKIQ